MIFRHQFIMGYDDEDEHEYEFFWQNRMPRMARAMRVYCVQAKLEVPNPYGLTYQNVHDIYGNIIVDENGLCIYPVRHGPAKSILRRLENVCTANDIRIGPPLWPVSPPPVERGSRMPPLGDLISPSTPAGPGSL